MICPRCDGKGYCESSDGTGRDIVCPKCHFTGVVADMPAMRGVALIEAIRAQSSDYANNLPED